MTDSSHVVVLMATFNGAPWIEAQVRSILSQETTDTRLIISDDGSTDATVSVLRSLATTYPGRIELLPAAVPTGSPAQNFFRLVRDASVGPHEYVAFADQDDEWLPRKLDDQLLQLTQRGADGTSASVMAFNASGETRLVKKDWPEAKFDYLFQSPGPGSTHVLSPRAFALLRSVAHANGLVEISYHDWLDYALVRAHGWKWYVCPEPLVRYRQHEKNSMGANQGLMAHLTRFRMLREGWYHQQVLAISRLARNVARPPHVQSEIDEIIGLVTHRSVQDKITLIRRAGEFRRSPRDKMIFRALVLLGIW